MNQIWGHIWLLSFWIICGRQNLEDSASQMEEDEEMYRRFSLIKDMKVRITGYLTAFRSVTQSCPTLCNPMNHSMPGLPVYHQLPEFTQIHVHRVSDAIQPSHPLSSPSPPAPNPSQHQSFPMSQLFAWGGQSIGVSALASVLPMNTQDWSHLGWTGWISLKFEQAIHTLCLVLGKVYRQETLMFIV